MYIPLGSFLSLTGIVFSRPAGSRMMTSGTPLPASKNVITLIYTTVPLQYGVHHVRKNATFFTREYTFRVDFEMGRLVDEHAFGLYARSKHLDFVRIASRRVHVDVVRRFRSRHARKVYVHLVRSFDNRLVRSCISLTSIVIENKIDLKQKKKREKITICG